MIWNQPLLIMDIGGGSTEFIIGNGDQLLWKRSYPLGVSRLLELHRPSDPATSSDRERLYQHLDESLPDLYKACETHQPRVLVGSSGSFDTLRDVIHGGIDPSNSESNFYSFEPEVLHRTLHHSAPPNLAAEAGLWVNRWPRDRVRAFGDSLRLECFPTALAQMCRTRARSAPRVS